MIQERRELLIREISSRLLDGVKVRVLEWDEEKGEVVEIPLKVYSIDTDGYVHFEPNDFDVDYLPVEECLVYLRSMSSMTEEEKKEYTSYCFEQPFLQKDKTPNLGSVPMCIDWLNKKMFAYRTINGKDMFELCLALEAPKGMYKED